MDNPKTWRFWVRDTSDVLSVISLIIIVVGYVSSYRSRGEQLDRLEAKVNVLEDRLQINKDRLSRVDIDIAILSERISEQRKR